MVHDSLHHHGIGHERRYSRQIILAAFYSFPDPAMARSLLEQSAASHNIEQSLNLDATHLSPDQGTLCSQLEGGCLPLPLLHRLHREPQAGCR